MATYTANYGLHQWAAEDNFLRTDFNTDFSKIDAAIKGVSDAAASQAWAVDIKAQRALDALEPVSYNVCQLMLQNHYEGKYTGYKKAMVFDGFLDESQAESFTGGLAMDLVNQNLLLDAVGQGDWEACYGGNALANTLMPGGTRLINWRPTGNGTLTGVSYFLTGTAQLTVRSAEGDTLATSAILYPSDRTTATRFPVSVSLRAGHMYIMEMKNAGSGELKLYMRNSSDSLPGCRFHITPAPATTGTMTSVLYPAGTWKKILVWVLHSAGTVSMQVQRNGTWLSLTPAGTVSARNRKGEACLESAFSLEPGQTQNLRLRLTANTSAGVSVRLFNYGAVLI